MGDYAPLAVTIYAVPDDEAAKKALAVFEDYGLGEEWGEGSDYDDIRLGEPWADDEASVGVIHEISAKLIVLGVTFRAHEDPKYEWLGTLIMYTPKLGRYEQTADADGNPVFFDNEVRDIVAMRLTDQDPGGSLMERRLGKPWFDALALL